jgi:hypothetical protein
MNDLNDRAVYFGKNAQWRKLKDRGCITDIVCFSEDQLDTLDRDFIFAKKGSTYSGTFCISMTTGKCQQKNRAKDNDESEEECTTDIFKIISKLSLNQICPKHQVKIPS